jgi:hypothetical protein
VVVDPERVEPQIFDGLSPIQESQPVAARPAAVNAEANPLGALGYPRMDYAAACIGRYGSLVKWALRRQIGHLRAEVSATSGSSSAFSSANALPATQAAAKCSSPRRILAAATPCSYRVFVGELDWSRLQARCAFTLHD